MPAFYALHSRVKSGVPALPPGDVSVVQFQIAGTAFLQRDLMTAVRGGREAMQRCSSGPPLCFLSCAFTQDFFRQNYNSHYRVWPIHSEQANQTLTKPKSSTKAPWFAISKPKATAGHTCLLFCVTKRERKHSFVWEGWNRHFCNSCQGLSLSNKARTALKSWSHPARMSFWRTWDAPCLWQTYRFLSLFL